MNEGKARHKPAAQRRLVAQERRKQPGVVGVSRQFHPGMQHTLRF